MVRPGITAAAGLALAAAAPLPGAERKRPRLKKGLMYNSFSGPSANRLSVRRRFELAQEAGFEGIEIRSALNQAEVLAARDATGLAIPSVTGAVHWVKTLSDPNPAVRADGLAGLLQALRDAKAYGASSVLLVPAVVSAGVSYADAWRRSVAEIRKALPLAEELGVAIAIENVWNQFLLSPLEAARYVDQFASPWVRWHFDIGNVLNTGWPEQWIPVLGARIAHVHVKEFSRKLRDERGPRAGFNVELLRGDNDWPAIMRALDGIGYQGWMITEQRRPEGMDDAAYLAYLVRSLQEIFAL